MPKYRQFRSCNIIDRGLTSLVRCGLTTWLGRARAGGARTFAPSLHSRVATPLYLCHFARLNVDLKWAAWPCKALFRERHNVVPWAEKESEATLIVRCKRCDRALLVGNRK